MKYRKLIFIMIGFNILLNSCTSINKNNSSITDHEIKISINKNYSQTINIVKDDGNSDISLLIQPDKNILLGNRIQGKYEGRVLELDSFGNITQIYFANHGKIFYKLNAKTFKHEYELKNVDINLIKRPILTCDSIGKDQYLISHFSDSYPNELMEYSVKDVGLSDGELNFLTNSGEVIITTESDSIEFSLNCISDKREVIKSFKYLLKLK